MISTERISDQPLALNACGINHINSQTRGSTRPGGRIDYHILYIASGVCNVKFNERDGFTPVSSGSIILFRPCERQEYFFRAGSHSVSYFIHFEGKDCREILSQLGILDITVFNMGKSTAFEDTFAKMELEYSLKKPQYEHYCAALLHQLLTIISRKYELSRGGIDRENEKRINAALDMIYKNLGREITVDELAELCCLSSGHFSHLFKEVVGSSPYAYISFLRLERARDLLLGTELTIKEISTSVGFTDQNYFSRLFKKHTGQSPLEYRKNI